MLKVFIAVQVVAIITKFCLVSWNAEAFLNVLWGAWAGTLITLAIVAIRTRNNEC